MAKNIFFSALLLVSFWGFSAEALVGEKEAGEKEKVAFDYKLGPGDVINIAVFDEASLSIRAAVINETGKIAYPLLGEVEAGGYSAGQLAEIITSYLEGPYLTHPKVSITIAKYRNFYIAGEVRRPGAYSYQPHLTLHKAVALAGGFTDSADLSELLVVHENTIDAMAITLNSKILPGDILTVSGLGPFFINGAIKNPGGYPLRKDLSLRKAVALAGGFTERASKTKISLIHENDPAQKQIKVGLNQVIQSGDIITVGESFF